MPPRRTTLTYSSENAPELDESRVYVYYCQHSGRHVLTTDCNLATAPRRATDGALVVDTQRYTARLYNSQDGGTRLLRRGNGKVERQHRIAVGKLPFAYRSEQGGRYLYIMDGAVTAYAGKGAVGDASADAPPVPPCIVERRSAEGADDGAGGEAPTHRHSIVVTLEIDDRAPRTALLRVAADAVRLSTKAYVGSERLTEEVLEYLRGVLGVRLSQLTLERGDTSRRPRAVVTSSLARQQVFDKLAAALPTSNASILPLRIYKRRL